MFSSIERFANQWVIFSPIITYIKINVRILLCRLCVCRCRLVDEFEIRSILDKHINFTLADQVAFWTLEVVSFVLSSHFIWFSLKLSSISKRLSHQRVFSFVHKEKNIPQTHQPKIPLSWDEFFFTLLWNLTNKMKNERRETRRETKRNILSTNIQHRRRTKKKVMEERKIW